MLTTSPVISNSSNNGSPRSFGIQYGSSTRSPHQQGTSRRQGDLPRRQTSMSASSQHQLPVVAGSMTTSPKGQSSQQRISSARTAVASAVAATATAQARASSFTSSSARNTAASQQPSNASSSEPSNESGGGPSQPPSPPPQPRLLGDTQPQENPCEVPELAASTTMSSSKRPNPADSDDDGGGQTAAAEPSARPAQRPRQSASPAKRLPAKYEQCSVDDIVILISNMLVELIETNDNIPLRHGSLTRFHSRTAPGISVEDYLFRLARHATLTPPLLLSMVYYIDRLCAQYPQFTINTLTVHRFLITAATVAAKGLSDSFWNNTTYAKVGGVRVQELNLLELEFLHRVEWRIVPNPEVLVAYYTGLIERHPGYVSESSRQCQAATTDEEGGDDNNNDSEVGDVEQDDDELGDSDSDDISDDSAEPAPSTAESAPG